MEVIWYILLGVFFIWFIFRDVSEELIRYKTISNLHLQDWEVSYYDTYDNRLETLLVKGETFEDAYTAASQSLEVQDFNTIHSIRILNGEDYK